MFQDLTTLQMHTFKDAEPEGDTAIEWSRTNAAYTFDLPPRESRGEPQGVEYTPYITKAFLTFVQLCCVTLSKKMI